MTAERPDMTTDRAVLSGDAYATDRHLSARQSLYQYQVPQYDLPKIVSGLIGPAGGIVADVGCGNGWYVRSLREEHPYWTVIGIDLSAGMLAGLGTPIVQADAMQLPLADGSVDVVLAMHMIYHLPDIPAGLAELARVLRPGGMLIASTNAADDKAELDDLWSAAAARVTGKHACRRVALSSRFRLDDAPTILRDHFEDISIHELHGRITVTTPDPIVAHLGSYESFANDAGVPFHEAVHVAHDVLVDHINERGSFRIGSRSGIITARRGAP